MARAVEIAFRGWVPGCSDLDLAFGGWSSEAGAGATVYGAATLAASTDFFARALQAPWTMGPNLIFGGVGLNTYGVAVRQMNGLLDLCGVEQQRNERTGSTNPHVVDLRRTLPKLTVDVGMAQSDHATMLTNLATLRALLSPAQGFLPLTRTDTPDRTIYARCLGFPISEQDIPFATNVALFQLQFERLSFEEDLQETVFTLTNLPVATNIMLNPRPAHAAASLPDSWQEAATRTTVTYSDGGVYESIVSKHIRIVGDPVLLPNAPAIIVHPTGVSGEVAAGDTVTFSCAIGEASGTPNCSMQINIYVFGADGFITNSSNTPFTPGLGFATYTKTMTMPAGATWVQAWVEKAGSFHQNEVLEFSIAACYLSITAGPYFDGSLDFCDWTGTVDASTSVRYGNILTNAGDLEVDAVYECTVSSAMSGGLSFSVNGRPFTYSGALASGDVLTVHTEIQDAELGGVSVFRYVVAGSHFPRLAPGDNTITLSDDTKFSLTVRYHRRYE